MKVKHYFIFLYIFMQIMNFLLQNLEKNVMSVNLTNINFLAS